MYMDLLIQRLNGDDGTIIWDRTYSNGANLYEFDGIRMTISASDGYIYAAGFVNGDEAGTIFVELYMAYPTGNPTRLALEKNISALENGKHGLCYSSGLRARLLAEVITNCCEIFAFLISLSSNELIDFDK